MAEFETVYFCRRDFLNCDDDVNYEYLLRTVDDDGRSNGTYGKKKRMNTDGTVAMRKRKIIALLIRNLLIKK